MRLPTEPAAGVERTHHLTVNDACDLFQCRKTQPGRPSGPSPRRPAAHACRECGESVFDQGHGNQSMMLKGLVRIRVRAIARRGLSKIDVRRQPGERLWSPH
jgi:hypothetical protein